MTKKHGNAELVALFELVPRTDLGPEACELFGSVGESIVAIRGEERLKQFDTLIKAYVSNDKSLADTYTEKDVSDELGAFVKRHLASNTPILANQADEFRAKLAEAPIKEFSVLRHVHGAIIGYDRKSFSLGPFKFYSWPEHRDQIASDIKAELKDYMTNGWEGVVVCATTKARSPGKATEIIDDKFHRLDRVLNYMVGFRSEYRDLGVLNARGWRSLKMVIAADGKAGVSIANSGSLRAITINSPHFMQPSIGHDYIWAFCFSPNANSLQESLSMAIFWLGQSTIDINVDVGFVQIAMGLEAVLTYDEPATINASIVHQLSEAAALLVGQSVKERLAIEKSMKNYYRTRSAVAHGGTRRVSAADFSEFLDLATRIVRKLTSTPECITLKSKSDLRTLLQTVKYGGAGKA